jgi:hypothetical protein
MRHTGNRIGGSNPSLSAIVQQNLQYKVTGCGVTDFSQKPITVERLNR